MSLRSCLAVAGTLLVLCLVCYPGAASANSHAGGVVQVARASTGEPPMMPLHPEPALQGQQQNFYLAENQAQEKREEKEEHDREREKKVREEAREKRQKARQVSAQDIAEVNRGLNSARLILQKMPPAYAGHRANALKDIDQALWEVQQMYDVNP
jgi:predicted component of type VI protein secretion system